MFIVGHGYATSLLGLASNSSDVDWHKVGMQIPAMLFFLYFSLFYVGPKNTIKVAFVQ